MIKVLILAGLFCLITISSFAQTFDSKFVFETLREKLEQEDSSNGSKPLLTNRLSGKELEEYLERHPEYAKIGETGDIKYRTTSMPITFSRLDPDSSGTLRLGASFTPGAAHYWVWGRGTLQADGKIKLEPEFFLGLAVNAGVKQDPNDGKSLVASLTIGGVIGFSNMGLLIGAEVVDRIKVVLGLSQRIDNIPLLKGWTSIPDFPRVSLEAAD